MSVRKNPVRNVAYMAVMAAIIVASKEALSSLPNIELVSLLIALFTVYFGKLTVGAIYIYVFIEGLLYGFTYWWFIPYMYVWTLLWAVCSLMKKTEEPIIWACVLGTFGLAFGFLFALLYFVLGDWSVGYAYFLSGLGFDLLHAAGNFVLTLILWKPLSRALKRITESSHF